MEEKLTPQDITTLLWLYDNTNTTTKHAEDVWRELEDNAHLFTPVFLRQAEACAMCNEDAYDRFKKYLPDLITLKARKVLL